MKANATSNSRSKAWPIANGRCDMLREATYDRDGADSSPRTLHRRPGVGKFRVQVLVVSAGMSFGSNLPGSIDLPCRED